jgi:tRNA(adenine34) deaminase
MEIVAPSLLKLDLDVYMRAALAEAEMAGQAGELPIGAVVVIDGDVVSRGRARHQQAHSQLHHAEINALLGGGERLWRDYRQAVLFTTVEPCPMCLGAVVMADVPHIVFALHDRVVHSMETIESNPYVRRHIHSYYGGVLAAEAASIFERYAPEALHYIQMGRVAYRSAIGLPSAAGEKAP